MSDHGDRHPPQDEDLVEVTRVLGPFEADLIKNFLESQKAGLDLFRRNRLNRWYPASVFGPLLGVPGFLFFWVFFA